MYGLEQHYSVVSHYSIDVHDSFYSLVANSLEFGQYFHPGIYGCIYCVQAPKCVYVYAVQTPKCVYVYTVQTPKCVYVYTVQTPKCVYF